MKLYVVRDGVFTLKNGAPASPIVDYERFSKRYTDVFDRVVCVGRLFNTEDASASPVTGRGVSFHAVPGYRGPWGFMKNLPAIIRAVKGAIEPDAAYILRIPATIPSLFACLLWWRKIPFAVEVVADPYDGYSPQVLKHPLARLFRAVFVRLTRWQCRHAVASAYVTKQALQRRYPPAAGAPTFAYTSLDLHADAFASAPKAHFNVKQPHLVTIGMMQQHLKGHDVLIKALRHCHDAGLPACLTIIGDGRLRTDYTQLAADLELAEHITFKGLLPAGQAVRGVLDEADIFILASRQEGLPRAMIEAMARGLPCLGSDVGGMSELLAAENLVPVDDPVALSAQIMALCADETLLQQNAARNLTTAQNYAYETVQLERVAFYTKVREVSGR